MKGGIDLIKYMALIALCCMGLNGYGQSKQDLQKQRDKINEQIEYTKTLIKETEKDQKSTNQQLRILNKQISLRQRLIKNINTEITDIEDEIQSKQQLIVDLENDIEALKEEYARMIYQSYKNRRAHDQIMYIFSSDDFNQAYKRLKMLSHYTEVRTEQAEDIAEAQMELRGIIAALEVTSAEKKTLASQKQQESSELNQDKSVREKTLSELKNQTADLHKKQQQQEAERQRLNKAIQRIIEEELRAEKDKNNGVYALTPEGKIISEKFEKNKGQLPWPVLRGVVTQKFGKQAHPTIPGIEIENNGVDITTDKNSSVIAVFDGEVTSLFSFPGSGYNVIVTHGGYKSVYTNLKEVHVKKGDKITAKESIGKVLTNGDESIAHIEIWKITAEKGTPQNPEYWLSKR
jgi:septal ring factor EnvC (AmiA/AmiB activator)